MYTLVSEFDSYVLVGHNPECTNETHSTVTCTWQRMAHVSFSFNISINRYLLSLISNCVNCCIRYLTAKDNTTTSELYYGNDSPGLFNRFFFY